MANSRGVNDNVIIITDPMESAKAVGLRYVTDAKPGIRRIGAAKNFSYVDPDGNKITDSETLNRIKSLVIPPAWTDVWICSSPNGHLQATGRDARGRKQYRYHPKFKSIRDDSKFGKMVLFAEALPKIRDRVDHDLALPKLSREKILAAVVRLLETTLIRVGNEEYARANNSYGLTTMRNNHANVFGSKIHFQFRGKGGKLYNIGLRDKRLARVIRRCQELPGQDLFCYVNDEGKTVDVTSQDVNDYLREITGQEFTAKDFRTWAATVLACMALQDSVPYNSATQAKKNIVRAVERVAEQLGNTPSICRKSYIHPAILEGYLDGSVLQASAQKSKRYAALAPEERLVVGYLSNRLAKAS